MWCICAGINAASLEVLSVALGAWINPFIKRYCVFIRIPCTSQTGYMSRHIVFYVGATIRTTSHPCPTKALFTVVTQQFQICLFPGHTGQYRKRPLPSQDSQVPHGYSRPDRLRHVEKSDVMEAAIRHASIQNQHSNTLRGSSLQNSHCLSISVPSSQSHVVSTTTTPASPMSLLIPEHSTGFDMNSEIVSPGLTVLRRHRIDNIVLRDSPMDIADNTHNLFQRVNAESRHL